MRAELSWRISNVNVIDYRGGEVLASVDTDPVNVDFRTQH